jgi:hypothetical protein
MACSDENHDRSRRPDAEYQGWSHRSGTRWPSDWDVGRCYVRSTPYTWRWWARVSWLSLKTKADGLWVVWPQNHSDGFLRFGLKTGGDGFLRFGLKTGVSDFSGWAQKSTAVVWWFEPQNYRDDFLVWTSKLSRLRFVNCATKLMEGGWRRTHVKIWWLASPRSKSR